MALTVNEIKNAKPGDKDRKLADSGGLYVLLTSKGAKLWRMKYRFGGIEKKLSFGSFPQVSLQQARRMRDEARMALMDVRDPARERKLEKQSRKAALGQTFGAIGLEFLEKRRMENLAKSTLDKKAWVLRLLTSKLGNVPITDITPKEMFNALEQIQDRGARVTAYRARSLSGEIFNYAIATGRASSNPTVVLKGALLTPQVKHLPAIIDAKGLSKL